MYSFRGRRGIEKKETSTRKSPLREQAYFGPSSRVRGRSPLSSRDLGGSGRTDDGQLRLAEVGDRLVVELEVGLDEGRRGEREPL